jgi:hypothetical protein
LVIRVKDGSFGVGQESGQQWTKIQGTAWGNSEFQLMIRTWYTIMINLTINYNTHKSIITISTLESHSDHVYMDSYHSSQLNLDSFAGNSSDGEPLFKNVKFQFTNTSVPVSGVTSQGNTELYVSFLMIYSNHATVNRHCKSKSIDIEFC